MGLLLGWQVVGYSALKGWGVCGYSAELCGSRAIVFYIWVNGLNTQSGRVSVGCPPDLEGISNFSCKRIFFFRKKRPENKNVEGYRVELCRDQKTRENKLDPILL